MAERTPSELAALRAAAEETLADPSRARDEYLATKANAVLATGAWLAGERATAPASDLEVAADAHQVKREILRATDAERRLRRETGRGTWPGTVGQMLSWYLCRDHAEAPV